MDNPASEERTRTGRRVLIIDDDRDTVDMVEEMLRRLGHQVATAGDADEALRAIATFQPEVVLLDILLPDVSGLELLQRLRAALERPCRFVALSGMAREQDLELGMAAGFDVYLTKPFRMNTLLAELEHVA